MDIPKSKNNITYFFIPLDNIFTLCYNYKVNTYLEANYEAHQDY